jgi:hypothetical protein
MNYRMLASNIYHLANYSLKKPKNDLEKGALIFSIDVDAADKRLGKLNNGENDFNVHNRLTEYQVGEIEEFALPMFINAFDSYEIPATFAIRGQLAELDFRVRDVFGAKTIHEIASHGYYHKPFGLMSFEEAEKELTLTSQGLSKLGIKPASFIFPRNQINHLSLLSKYGYKTYRSLGGLKRDSMFIEKKGSLFDIHPSLYLDNHVRPYFLRKIFELSIGRKTPLHIWFHLWNFGDKQADVAEYITKTFVPFLKQAQKKFDEGVLSLDTMNSIADSVYGNREQS